MTIPTNFRVPKNCHHEWILFCNNECIGTLVGVPGRKQIEHWCREPIKPHNSALVMSRNLGWIQESVKHLRFLCKT